MMGETFKDMDREIEWEDNEFFFRPINYKNHLKIISTKGTKKPNWSVG